MEEHHVIIKTKCLNSSAPSNGNFCQQCGQAVRDNTDRSIGKLLGEFFGNIFFLDNRFLLSVWYLFRYTGLMTVEFLKGKLKKFISPITLFLFFNLIYFFVNPLSDYSLSLVDQVYSQPYSDWVREWVVSKLKTEGLEGTSYAVNYQNSSDTISKSIMIINIPMIALFVYLLALKKRRFYYDSLIFAFHFFSLFMASWIMLPWVSKLLFLITGDEDSLLSNGAFHLFAFVIPGLYAIFSIQRFMKIRWYWAIPVGILVLLSVNLANLFYRFIIFLFTFWST
ncbi:hypothetical protein BFP77_15380 [Maribacter sp. 4U21]|uniref:DUF3667 domain-containing protein n=1 Tax=Maribacter sp. 4U21 TaxID=1889779 RepID=UPI000C162726|nr:DUF3667 domain-containing protein [Maribacter sp. 4U21]PIB23696.1 hypothetical protein BFP77_15380 [Maribacter sp. 4U21]